MSSLLIKVREKAIVPAAAVVTSMAMAPMTAFAQETGGVADDVAAALQSTASDITSVLGSVAPVALGIGGVFLAWRYGMRFFKSLSK